MALSLIVEEERGTFNKRARRHNGYYGGDFGTLPLPAGPSFPSALGHELRAEDGRPRNGQLRGMTVSTRSV